MSDSLLAEEGGDAAIPKDHRLDVQIVERQMLGVFSHSAGEHLSLEALNARIFKKSLIKSLIFAFITFVTF